MPLRKHSIAAALAGGGLLLPLCLAQAAPAPKPAELAVELHSQIAALKAQVEERLKEQEAEARKREDEVRKQNAVELERLRKEAAEREAQERNEWQAANQRLQDELKAAAVREEARERNAAPSVGVGSAGISLGGYVQSDLQIRQSSQDQLNQTSGQPLNQDRFMVRRARLLVEVERRYLEGGLELDGNTMKGASAGILGARASFKLPGANPGDLPLLMLSAGALRIPFGFELTEDDRERPFMERTTLSRALFPSEFDLGVRVQANWRFLRCALALMNGGSMQGGSFEALDPNHQKDLVGRLGADTGPGDLRARGGISALYGKGFHSGDLASKPVVRWTDVDGNGAYSPSNETSVAAGMAASPSRNFARFAFSADATFSAKALANFWALGVTTLRAELTMAKNLDRALIPADPYGELARDSRELGFAIGLTQVLLGHGIVGARFDYYDPDRDRYVRSSGDLVPSNLIFTTWSFMAGLVSPWGRLLFQYDLNRNHLGLDTGTLPGNLADNAFTARAEVVF